MILIYIYIYISYIYIHITYYIEREISISFHITIPSSSFFRRIFLLDVPSFSACFFPSLPIHGRHHSAPPGSAAPGSGSGIRAPNAVRPWYAPQSQPRALPGSRALCDAYPTVDVVGKIPWKLWFFKPREARNFGDVGVFGWNHHVSPWNFGIWSNNIPIRRIGLALENLRFTHVETIGPAPPNTDPDSVWL